MDYQNIAVRILRTLRYASVIAAMTAPSYAMEHYTRPIQDQNGTAIPGATVTVYRSGTTTLAAIYSDNGVTAKSNPFATAIDGLAEFYAANGVYDIVITHPRNLFTPSKTSGVALYDIRDSSVTTFPANPFIGQVVTLRHDGSIGTCQPSVEPGSVLNLCGWDGDSWLEVGGGGGSDTLATVTARENTTIGNDESNPLEIFGTGGQSTYGTQFYTHSGGEIVIRCITSAGANKCNYYRQVDDTYKGGWKDKDGTVKWEFNGTTGAIDKSTVNVTTADNVFTSYRRLVGCGGDLVGVDAATSTAGHIWDKVPTVTAPTATASVGTNQTVGLARFPDSDGDFGIQIKCRLPASVTIGQVDAVLSWVSAGTGNYRPQLFTKCYGDDAAADAAYNSVQAFTVAAGTATRGQIDTLSNVTMTGCSAGNELFLKLIRNRTEALDTGSSTFDVKSLELWATITE